MLARLEHPFSTKAAQSGIREAQLFADLLSRKSERHLFDGLQIQEPPTGSVAIPPHLALHLLGILERVHFQAVAVSPADRGGLLLLACCVLWGHGLRSLSCPCFEGDH